MLKLHKNIYIIYMIIYLIITILLIFTFAGYMEFTDQRKLLKLRQHGTFSDKEQIEYINLYPYWRLTLMPTIFASFIIIIFLHYLIKISNKTLMVFFLFISAIIYTTTYMALSYYLYHVVNCNGNSKTIKKWQNDAFNDYSEVGM